MDIASRTYDTSIGSPRSRRVALVRAPGQLAARGERRESPEARSVYDFSIGMKRESTIAYEYKVVLQSSATFD
jgi:hypothetical protein